MKTKTGMSLGLALTLMVGVFATMLALGLFTNTEVRAQAETETEVDDVTVQITPDTIDTVTEVTVAFQSTSDLDEGESIIIEFPGNMFVPEEINKTDVEIGSAAADDVEVDGQEVTLENPADITATTPVMVVFAIAAGIKAPAAEAGDTFMVKVSTSADTTPADSSASDALVDPTPSSDPGVRSVMVSHSPQTVGSAARVIVEFFITQALTANVDTITIEFEDDVGVPLILDRDDISIVGESETVETQEARPLDVNVIHVGPSPANDPEVTLTVGDHNPVDALVEGLQLGMVTVIFRNGAGITNPTEAGTWNVKVSTSKESNDEDEEAGTADDKVTSLDANSFRPVRMITLNADAGPRGSTLTATGRGFKNSTTATVFLDEDDDGEKQPAEIVLCDADIGSDDTFSCDFVVTSAFEARPTINMINAFDGRDQSAPDGAPYRLNPQIVAIPDTAAIGDTVTIELRDFPAGESDRFDIGGVAIAGGSVTVPDTGSVTVSRSIPNGVALGRQALRVRFGAGTTSYRDTMTITGAQLAVTPSTVVPNQSVTITGRGFTGGAFLDGNSTRDATTKEYTHTNTDDGGTSGIYISGTQIPWNKIDSDNKVEIDSGGSWVATVVIPVNDPTTVPGEYELKVFDSKGRPGVTTITIPERTIDFEPEESRVGTTLTVIGTGWVASNNAAGAENTNLSVDYFLPAAGESDASSRVNPDSDGNFSTTIRVPLNAEIPSTNRVEVSYVDKDGDTVRATAAHRVPGASITLTPSSGPGGTTITVTGAGFKAFTSVGDVYVGSTQVHPRPAGASVGRDGVLQSITILIPGLDPGTQSVKVDVGGSIVSQPFSITADDALPAATAEDTTPDVAFKELIDSGSLLTVFWYNEDTQSYLSYDPDPANAGFNDLETVGSGDIFWVRLSEDANFLGKLRRAEWAQVVLP